MKQVRGVGLFLLNKEGRFYAIKELVSKRGAVCKNPGDLSIPLETLDPEENHKAGVARLFKEEIDAYDVLKVTEPLYIGEYVSREKHLLTAVSLYVSFIIKADCLVFAGSHAGTEYEPHGFVSEEELIRKGRQGTSDLFRVWKFYHDEDIWGGG